MTQWHLKSKRKATGAIRTSKRRSDKKLAWMGGDASHTTIAQKAKKDKENTRGNTSKVKLKADSVVIVSNQKNPKEKAKKMVIISVEANNADRQFARRNVITKGAILKVKDGAKELYIKVTSRPGQAGTISGIILEGYEKEKEEAIKTKKKASKAPKPEKEKISKPNKEKEPEKAKKE